MASGRSRTPLHFSLIFCGLRLGCVMPLPALVSFFYCLRPRYVMSCSHPTFIFVSSGSVCVMACSPFSFIFCS